jgi:7-cyano-7-deazaguanine reductase
LKKKLNPLGLRSEYPSEYSPNLLFPILRADKRRLLGIDSAELPFRGFDTWRAYEISWLNLRGKPEVAIGEFIVPANSPYLIESKSLKLYLNSLNQCRFDSPEMLQDLLRKDLSESAGSPVIVQLERLLSAKGLIISQPEGYCLDLIDIETEVYQPNPDLLMIDQNRDARETLYSDLFRSHCPVTGQPDWGTVLIRYAGPEIERSGLLKYLVSYREHESFHEDCVEQVFRDIQLRCRPYSLSVCINFMRRGGLEINPLRSLAPIEADFPGNRYIRQ